MHQKSPTNALFHSPPPEHSYLSLFFPRICFFDLYYKWASLDHRCFSSFFCLHFLNRVFWLSNDAQILFFTLFRTLMIGIVPLVLQFSLVFFGPFSFLVFLSGFQSESNPTPAFVSFLCVPN